MRYTYTKTHTTFTPANPFLICAQCNAWVDYWHWDGPPVNFPCGHRADYSDLCPSWGHLGYVAHAPARERLRGSADERRKALGQ